MGSFHQSANDTIVALSTPVGVGAIGLIRVSGEDAITLVNSVFNGHNLILQTSHTAHVGKLIDGDDIIDEVVVTLFKAPYSFTKENVAEISCHGSSFIINKIIALLLQKGGRYAKPGEFTQRAFLNGRMDLSQAEAVADLIASENQSSHKAAMHQMRGGFSKEIKGLRDQLIHFASMIELELDFAEEDVEFADRKKLKMLTNEILAVLIPLINSFAMGNAIKNGIPVVIIGRPNAGKSTLLNALFNEEKAMVSEIAGTTRDVIEDELNIDGISFRFIDTAGLRQTSDKLEVMGIERTNQKIKQASLIIYLFDVTTINIEDVNREVLKWKRASIPILLVGNKVDLLKLNDYQEFKQQANLLNFPLLLISADRKQGIEELKNKLVEMVNLKNFNIGSTVVTNIRHLESLSQTKLALEQVNEGIDTGLSQDLISLEIRAALYHLGLITGEITTDDLLENIFSKFCIGK